MTNVRKNYLIENIIKKIGLYKSIEKLLESNYTLLENSFYKISIENINKIKQKYTIDEYIKRICDIINKEFSENELEIIINFYSTFPGKKLLDNNLNDQLEKIGKDMISEIYKEFSLLNK
jgi:hypothetical protein